MCRVLDNCNSFPVRPMTSKFIKNNDETLPIRNEICMIYLFNDYNYISVSLISAVERQYYEEYEEGSVMDRV